MSNPPLFVRRGQETADPRLVHLAASLFVRALSIARRAGKESARDAKTG